VMGKPKRAALYVRVSTDHQSVENQVRELRQVAERRGWQVVEIYRDAGISGAKGRDRRPGLDAMLKDANRRKFDVVMAWAIDRLGRSLIDLLGTIEHLQEVGVDLYLDQQHIDTTTPTGKLLFQITGAFAEFDPERFCDQYARTRARDPKVTVALAQSGQTSERKHDRHRHHRAKHWKEAPAGYGHKL
jgi:DNA invertase Pin-like site-specific DNA recombinase